MGANGVKVREREVEEKIVVEPDFYFVVDCPSLHIIPAAQLDSTRRPLTEVRTFRAAAPPRCWASGTDSDRSS